MTRPPPESAVRSAYSNLSVEDVLMARRKNAPESIRVKHGLSDRLRTLRNEFYGERGGPDLARTLGIPVRTWYNYENGVTVPAEIILRIVELTSVEPTWLLRGEGPKFRSPSPTLASAPNSKAYDGLTSSPITTLLRVALERLEEEERSTIDQHLLLPIVGRSEEDGLPVVPIPIVDGHIDGKVSKPSATSPEGLRTDGIEANGPFLNLRVPDDSMSPIVAEGAYVAYAEEEPATEALHDKMVVAWIEGVAVVRWFQHCGRFILLRAENPTASPPSILVDLDRVEGLPTFHRVLWISTPH